ncbi:MAG: alpha-amylase family glycosyl hydrolase [Micrococcales bacterium]|nr:alpha-amylase family glycosyl hydrolase [Micrococcales bacterium]
MDWTEHTIWWHMYPLGFVGAPIRDWPGPHSAEAAQHAGEHRLGQVTAWLDHVLALGANGLLLGPVFTSATHGYDTLDHDHVDPRLGTDDDLDALVAAAHDRGVRVCLDGVFNHVSRDHPRVRAALADGPHGPDADWFAIDWDAPGGPRPAVFEGHDTLVELNHANPAVRAWTVGIIDRWTARGVDAWRLDAAYAVDPGFWADVVAQVRARHRRTWFLAEVIHGDYRETAAASGVDSITQYQLWKAIWSALVDRNFFELEWALRRHNDLLAAFVPNTFVGNHDVTRIASKVGPDAAALALVVLATVGGIPSVYAGDELGWTGVKTDGWDGDDAVRPAFVPAPTLPWDGPEGRAFRLHQQLLGLRRRHPWLVRAHTRTLELTNTHYVYQSTADAGSLIVDLDITTTPRAQVRSPHGEVLATVSPSEK